MKHVAPTEARTTRTPAAVMASLATPATGSPEISTWSLTLPAGASSPVHTIDRDQVYLPLSGTITVTVGGDSVTAKAGEAVVINGAEERQFAAGEDQDLSALVVMRADGAVVLPNGDKMPVPWAQ